LVIWMATSSETSMRLAGASLAAFAIFLVPYR
jgi:hypothetical protein